MKLCTAVQEGCGYKDTLQASLLCSVGKIFHCVHYLSAAPRIIQRIKEAKVTFNNKKQLLCSNNLSFEMKKKLIKSRICSVALYGSETWTLGKNEERIINSFETWCWRRI